jgi:hypothetical protein
MTEATFSETYLRRATFSETYLREATFSETYLRGATFSETDMTEATFSETYLTGATFSETDMTEATFSETDLYGATFSETYLYGATFSETDLREVRFLPACIIPTDVENSPNHSLGTSLEDVQLEDGTDLRGADLSGARLYQTAFRDVRINDGTQFGLEDGNYGEKCRYDYDPNTDVSVEEDTSRLEAAAWTYRRLESLFEENAIGDRARNAHIRKEEAERSYQKKQIQNGALSDDPWLVLLRRFIVSSLNWRLHRHGESLTQLLKISVGFIFACGILYPFVGGIGTDHSEGPYRITSISELFTPEMWGDIANGLYFSAITFTTIGYGDFYPAGTGSRILVALESLAGALIIALFVFVIGRRVAR